MDNDKEDICIIYPNKTSSSETFIQEHIRNMPGNVHILYGGWFPTSAADDVPLSSFFVPTVLNGIMHDVAALLGGSFSLYMRRKALLSFFRKKRIKAVVAEYGLTGAAVMDVCEEAGIPLIVHFHGFDAYLNTVIAEHKEKYKEMFNKASALIAVSRDMKQQLISLGAPPAKIHYNACGVDICRFRENDNQIKEPLFLYAGRFVNKKAPHLAILSFSRVLKEIPNAKLIMIGDGGLGSSGELYLACKQLVSSMKLDQAVEFKGAVPNTDVTETMQKVLAFVQHSVRPENGDSEGTPVTILEACASGLPVIATRHGGIKDVIVDGETGYLVDEYDIDAMAERMILLARNPALAHTMGKAARNRVVENFAMSKSIGNLWAIVEDTVLKRK